MCYLCQRYNLKANHNFRRFVLSVLLVVLSMSKIQSESKSQQKSWMGLQVICCVIYVKDTIWKQITTDNSIAIPDIVLCYLCQRYNLKANHNVKRLQYQCFYVVLSMSKIQSESKSQPGKTSAAIWERCVIYVKDTIWKQITTVGMVSWCFFKLCYLCQRYNLKANHNYHHNMKTEK